VATRHHLDDPDVERVGYAQGAAPRGRSLGSDAVQLFLSTLTQNSMRWFALASSMGLWTYAAIDPEVLRLYAAGGFTVLVYLPMVMRRAR
jgi:hypothetical protein